MFTNAKDNNGKAPDALVYMPKGKHTICATVNGKPEERTVEVTEAAAAALQRDLESRMQAHAAGKAARPCGYFDHATGKAAFLPKQFSWDPDKGVLLQVEWTAAGRAAIEGRDYSYFSPRFALSPAGEVVGLVPQGVEVGSLVNDPAFCKIEAIAAARVSIEPEPGEKSGNLAPQRALENAPDAGDNGGMDEIKKKLGLAPEATEADVYAAIDKLKGDKDAATQAATASDEAKQEAEAACEEKKKECEEKQKECEALRAQLDSSQKAASDARKAAEDSFISAACAAGKIAPKGDAVESWRKLYATDAAAAVQAMNAIPGNAALNAANVAAGKANAPDGESAAMSAMAAQFAAIN